MIAIGNSKRPKNACRASFTLVELMVVLAIISILASAVLSAMFSVMEEAKVTRTQAQIAKLHELVGSQLEAYQTRAIRLNIPPGTTESPVKLATTRLWAIRDLMRMELPDRLTDLSAGATAITIPRDSKFGGGSVTVVPSNTSRWLSHVRRATVATGPPPTWTNPGPDGVLGNADDFSWTRAHQGAECLFLIVASIREGEGNGLDYFKEEEIGDVDGDGMREILDAWGNPIEFLRWAPGYISEIQPSDPSIAPDPFDPLNVDTRSTFRLIPLIYSSGPDGIYDITTDDPSSPIVYRNTSPPNDPYFSWGAMEQVGKPVDADGNSEINDFDNVNNHLIDAS